MFLEYELPQSIPDGELHMFVDWIREKQISFDILEPFGHFPEKIVSQALKLFAISEVRQSIIRLIVDRAAKHDSWLYHLDRSELSVDSRHAFWSAIVCSELNRTESDAYEDLKSTRLFSYDDFEWFVAQFRGATHSDLAKRWGDLALHSFNCEITHALDLIWEIAKSDQKVADALAQRTSCPIVPDERNWRKQEYERQRKPEPEKKNQAPSISVTLTSALDHFVAGNTHAFWAIIEMLWSDPDARNSSGYFDIQLTDGKAWKSLSPELKQRIIATVPRYLESQTVDESEVWDPKTNYRSCVAANPAFALLFDEAPEIFEDLDSSLWQKWIPVLLNYLSRHNGQHDSAFNATLDQAFHKAERESLAALRRFLNTHINEDHKRHLIWRLRTVWRPEIKAIFLDLIQKKWLKPTASKEVFHLLHENEQDDTRALLESILNEVNHPEVCSSSAPASGAVLLTAYPEEWGAKLLEIFQNNEAFGRRILSLSLSRRGQQSDWLSRLPPQTTADLWPWMEQQFSHDPWDDDNEGGRLKARWVGSEHEMADLKRAVLESLRIRGTRSACAAMADLARKRPDDFWLGDLLAEMRKTARRMNWNRPSPENLMRAFADSERRMIRTAGDLRSLILDSLTRYEDTLHGAPPATELWNETTRNRKKVWEPKDENNLSDCLVLHLKRDLKKRGIFASREVMIRKRFEEERAQLIDIVVTAVPFTEDGKPGDPVTVIVEVKCAWNDGVLKDMNRQLFARYLCNSEYDFGIYLVAYFSCKGWNRLKDSRISNGESRTSIKNLRAKLSLQAQQISTTEKRIDALVLDARITNT